MPACRQRPFVLLLLLAVALLPCRARKAAARNVEAGQVYVGAGLGPGIRLGHALGASAADFLLVGTGEYVAGKTLSVVADVVVGFGSTLPLWGRAGAKWRLADLELAISPYVQAQLAGGGLFHVMGANLRWLGARTGVGVDYFATARATFGAGLFANLGSTLGESPRFHGMVEVLIYASWSIVPAPKSPLSGGARPAASPWAPAPAPRAAPSGTAPAATP